MKKAFKILGIVGLVFLQSCNISYKKVTLSAEEAKEFLTTLKARVQEDGFEVPQYGTRIQESYDKENPLNNFLYETKFSKEIGSRYYYEKKDDSSSDSAQYFYEKDDKFYCYAESSSSNEYFIKEISSDEFAMYFYTFIENNSFSDSKLRSMFSSFFDSFLNLYELKEYCEADDNKYDEVSISITFIKYNESSFKIKALCQCFPGSSSDYILDICGECENYYEKCFSIKKYQTLDEYNEGDYENYALQEFKWNKIDYIYPNID